MPNPTLKYTPETLDALEKKFIEYMEFADQQGVEATHAILFTMAALIDSTTVQIQDFINLAAKAMTISDKFNPLRQPERIH